MAEEARQVFSWCVENELYEEAMVCLHRIENLRKPGTIENVDENLLTVLRKHVRRLEDQEMWDKISSSFQKAFKLFPNHPHVHYELGCFFHRSGNLLMAISEFRESLRYNPNNWEVKLCLENAKSQAVDLWHFRMLNDRNRNACYQKVISEELDGSGGVSVLDIGTGTGIFSMMAAQKCQKVYACESAHIMYKICESVLQANKMADRITVHNKSSLDLCVPDDIPERVSFVITEVFDAGLLGESALSTLKHAWDNLLLPPPLNRSNLPGPFGKVIPRSATIYVCLVECEWLRKSHRLVTKNFGPIDLSNVNVQLETNEPYNSEYLTQLPGGYRLLSKPAPLCTIDFNNPHEIEQIISGLTFNREVPCVEKGLVDCLALWFDLELNENLTINTGPESTSCWEQAIFPVVDVVEVSENEIVEFAMTVKEPVQLLSLNRKGERNVAKNGCKNIMLNGEWIRKLNSTCLASCIHESLMSCVNKNECKMLDHQAVPLSALLFATSRGGKCTVSNADVADKFLELCSCLDLPTDNISFLKIEELSEETSNTYDIIFYEPLQLSGLVRENIFHDVEFLKQKVLKENGHIFPNKIYLYGAAVDCPAFTNYWKVDNDHVLDFRIAEVMNGFQTEYQEDIYLCDGMGTFLSKQAVLMELSSYGKSLASRRATGTAEVVRSGTMNSLLYWAHLVYGNRAVLNTFCCDNLYALGAFSPKHEMVLEEGDYLEIACTLTCSVPQFHIEKHKRN